MEADNWYTIKTSRMNRRQIKSTISITITTVFVRKVPGVFGEKCPSISNPRRGEEHTPRQIPPDRIKNQARIKKSKKKGTCARPAYLFSKHFHPHPLIK